MILCDYEIRILRHIANPKPDDGVKPGAALWAAAEVLSVSGFVQDSQITEKGRKALGGAA